MENRSDTSGPRYIGKPKQNKCLYYLKQNILLILLALAMVIGLAMGLGIRYNNPEFGMDPRNVAYLNFPGELLLRMLKMMIIPLIVSSLIAGMAALPSRSAGRMGATAVIYYLSTTFIAVILGIILVVTIRPGYRAFDPSQVKVSKDTNISPVDALLDLIRNAVPNNLIAAGMQQYKTKYVMVPRDWPENSTVMPINGTMPTLPPYVNPKGDVTSSSNILGLVVFSIFIGVIIGYMGPRGEPLFRFFSSLHDAIIILVKLIIWYSPFGIIFLVASRVVGMKQPEVIFTQLGWYMLTVLSGLAIHGFIVLPVIFLIVTRKNPFKLMLRMAQALLTALATASSSATLPVTMRCLEDGYGVDRRVSRFVLPVGATINMDGTALYEAVASIFIAQTLDMPLDIGKIIIISITSTAAAIGAAGIPEAGLVTMAIVLTAVGLPTDSVGLIYAIDWLLDRFRTSVNVWGDSVGAGIVEHMCVKHLPPLKDEDQFDGEDDDDLDPEMARKMDGFSDDHDRDMKPVTNGKMNSGFVADFNEPRFQQPAPDRRPDQDRYPVSVVHVNNNTHF